MVGWQEDLNLGPSDHKPQMPPVMPQQACNIYSDWLITNTTQYDITWSQDCKGAVNNIDSIHETCGNLKVWHNAISL